MESNWSPYLLSYLPFLFQNNFCFKIKTINQIETQATVHISLVCESSFKITAARADPQQGRTQVTRLMSFRNWWLFDQSYGPSSHFQKRIATALRQEPTAWQASLGGVLPFLLLLFLLRCRGALMQWWTGTKYFRTSKSAREAQRSLNTQVTLLQYCTWISSLTARALCSGPLSFQQSGVECAICYTGNSVRNQ